MKSIIFNTEMVRAIMAGRKTQIRRVIKVPDRTYSIKAEAGLEWSAHWGESGVDIEGNPWHAHFSKIIRPKYIAGDVLRVRETWYYEMHMHDKTNGKPDLLSGGYSHRYVYKADSPGYPVDVGVGQQGWASPVTMPREAARLFLRVTDVRVERVQDISEEGAEAEGAGTYKPRWKTDIAIAPWEMTTNRTKFIALWDSLYAEKGHGWDRNPWVWVIEFERIEKPQEVEE